MVDEWAQITECALMLYQDFLEIERVVANKEAIEPKVHIGQIEIITCNSAHLLYELIFSNDYVRYSFVLNCTSSAVRISHIDPL